MVDKKIFLIFVVFALALGFQLNSLFFGKVSFEDLSSKEKHQRIIEERDLAIREAKEKGDYRCCIEPPCTMCFMEANKWNNQTEGTCACDDLIAKGEEPCPQCKNGFCSSSNSETECKIPGS